MKIAAFVRALAIAAVLAASAVLAAPHISGAPASSATCDEHATQADAQRAADTRDSDGDGVYCETLPCPCSSASPGRGQLQPAKSPSTKCTRPRRVQKISFSATKYPTIRQHFLDALSEGWPRTLVVNRPHADARRDRLLAGFATKAGHDRDEYPPAVGRGRGKGLRRVNTHAAGKRRSPTSPAQRTARTARRSASSCVASATALGSGTSSTSPTQRSDAHDRYMPSPRAHSRDCRPVHRAWQSPVDDGGRGEERNHL